MKEILFSILVLLILLSSCSRKTSDAKLLEIAYELSDSSIVLFSEKLSEIRFPDKLTQSQKAKYHLLDARNKLNFGKDVECDTLQKYSIAYYEKAQDSTELYYAHYIIAWSKYREKQYSVSLENISQSFPLLPIVNDVVNYYVIANLRVINLVNLKRFQEARDIANDVIELSQQRENRHEQMIGWVLLAMTEQWDNNVAESERLYLIALEKTDGFHHKEYILNKLALLMEKESKYEKALGYVTQLRNLQLNRKNVPRVNLMKAVLFQKQNKLDSAYHYAKLASYGKDALISNLATSHISDWLAAEGDFLNAYHKQQTASANVYEMERSITSKAMQDQYAKKELENENNLLKIKAQKRTLIYVVTLFILLSTVGVAYLIFYRKQRREREVYLKSKAIQLEQENIVLKQSKEISALREKEASLRESLFRKIDVLKKLPSITQTQSEEQVESQKISLTDDDWNELKQTIDDAYPAFTHKLKESFSQLTMEDICFCCFLKIDVSLQDLSDIYCVSKASITKRKYRIKTDKLYLVDKSVSLDDFLKLV